MASSTTPAVWSRSLWQVTQYLSRTALMSGAPASRAAPTLCGADVSPVDSAPPIQPPMASAKTAGRPFIACARAVRRELCPMHPQEVNGGTAENQYSQIRGNGRMWNVIDTQLHRGAQRVIGDLRELAALTSTPNGAQRVAWGPVWSKAREWLRQQAAPPGRTPVRDAAGNDWITLPGESARTVIVGGHLDSVPNGGWLDGTLGVLVALEVLRRYARPAKTPGTLRLVEWAGG